jgi:hypothetical protein
LGTMEKLAAKGKGLGESGNGEGRLRMDLVDVVGLKRTRAGDVTPVLSIARGAMKIGKSRSEGELGSLFFLFFLLTLS